MSDPDPHLLNPLRPPPSANATLSAIRGELDALLQPVPLTHAQLLKIARVAEAGADFLRAAGRIDVAKALQPPSGDEDADEAGVTAPAPLDSETYGSKLIREALPALGHLMKQSKDTTESMVRAIAHARMNGLHEVADALEKKALGAVVTPPAARGRVEPGPHPFVPGVLVPTECGVCGAPASNVTHGLALAPAPTAAVPHTFERDQGSEVCAVCGHQAAHALHHLPHHAFIRTHPDSELCAVCHEPETRSHRESTPDALHYLPRHAFIRAHPDSELCAVCHEPETRRHRESPSAPAAPGSGGGQ